MFSQMKAVQKFKKLVDPAKHPHMHSILGLDDASHLVQPPMEMEADEGIASLSTYKHILRDTKKSHPAAHPQSSSRERGRSPRRHDSTLSLRQTATVHVSSSREDTPSGSVSEGTRGHARDPLEEEHLFLNIGPSTFSGLARTSSEQDYPVSSSSPIPIPDPQSTTNISEHTTLSSETTKTEIETTDDFPIVSESPGASEIDIYETAYREEIERIKRRSIARRDTSTIYLTRRVEDKKYHLNEVMKLLHHPTEPTTTSTQKPVQGEQSADEFILRLGGKVSGAVTSAQAVFKSALTTQIEARESGKSSSSSSGGDTNKQASGEDSV